MNQSATGVKIAGMDPNEPPTEQELIDELTHPDDEDNPVSDPEDLIEECDEDYDDHDTESQDE